MADIDYRIDSVRTVPRMTDWGAIWAGVFTFIAIWSVFGLLEMAIFASASTLACSALFVSHFQEGCNEKIAKNAEKFTNSVSLVYPYRI